MGLDTLKDAFFFYFYEFEDSINNINIDDVIGFRRCEHYILFSYFIL